MTMAERDRPTLCTACFMFFSLNIEFYNAWHLILQNANPKMQEKHTQNWHIRPVPKIKERFEIKRKNLWITRPATTIHS
jgi:hypothetical protein